MGIYSEALAESNARDYEEILLAVIVDYYDYDHIQDTYPKRLALFAKEHIYPKYQKELQEAYRNNKKKDQKKIEKFFKEIK